MSKDVSPDQCRALVDTVRVLRMATVRADGRVDMVPITFAWSNDRLVTAVDHKKKSTTELQRLDNIKAFPGVTLLADHYDEADWSGLWWVRMRGMAKVHTEGRDFEEALDALQERYAQYAERRPTGPAIIIDVADWHAWQA